LANAIDRRASNRRPIAKHRHSKATAEKPRSNLNTGQSGPAGAMSMNSETDFKKIETEYELLERNRKFAAVLRVARAVDDFETRLAPSIDPVKVEIDWPKIEDRLRCGSEQVAFHWMKAFWEGAIPEGSNALSFLWMTDCKIKEAIVCAIAECTFANYVLDEKYRTPRST